MTVLQWLGVCLLIIGFTPLGFGEEITPSHYGIITDGTCRGIESDGGSCTGYDWRSMFWDVQIGEGLGGDSNMASKTDRIIMEDRIRKWSIACVSTGQCEFFRVSSISFWHEPHVDVSGYMKTITISANQGITKEPISGKDIERYEAKINEGTEKVEDMVKMIDELQTQIKEDKIRIDSLAREVVTIRQNIIDVKAAIVEKSAWLEYLEFSDGETEEEAKKLDELQASLQGLSVELGEKEKDSQDTEGIVSAVEADIAKISRSIEKENEKIKSYEMRARQPGKVITDGGNNMIVWNVNQLWVSPLCNEAVFESRGNPAEIGALVIFMEGDCEDTSVLDGVFELYHTVEWTTGEVNVAESPAWQEREEWKRKALECKVKC